MKNQKIECENIILHYTNLLNNIEKYGNRYNKKNIKQIISEYKEKLKKIKCSQNIILQKLQKTVEYF